MTASHPEHDDSPEHAAEYLAVVAELKWQLGDDQASGLLDAFRSDLQGAAASLLATNSPTEIATQAHKVVSLAGGLGFRQLAGEARKLETFARSMPDSVPDESKVRFEAIFRHAEEHLSRLLDSSNNG